MRKKELALGCLCVAIAWGGYALLHGERVDPVKGTFHASRATDREASPPVASLERPANPPVGAGPKAADGLRAKPEAEPAVTIQYPDGVEGIKQRIYDINVEYVEDLEKLDAMGRVRDLPPEALWTGEWSSVDDWKRRRDGFRIEQGADGRYAFFPDSDSSRSYAWDEEKGEFSWDLDYYGKIISHKARFIDENTLVLMTISGRKVALDIYSKKE